MFSFFFSNPFAAEISLSQKLKEELNYEKESLSSTEPEFLTKFLKDKVWKVYSFLCLVVLLSLRFFFFAD